MVENQSDSCNFLYLMISTLILMWPTDNYIQSQFIIFNNFQVMKEYGDFNHIAPDPDYIQVKVHGFRYVQFII